MAVFGQYIEIKMKNQKLWKQNRNCLAVFIHFIVSFENYIKMKGVLKLWNMFVFLFWNVILLSIWKFTMAALGHHRACCVGWVISLDLPLEVRAKRYFFGFV